MDRCLLSEAVHHNEGKENDSLHQGNKETSTMNHACFCSWDYFTLIARLRVFKNKVDSK